MRPTLESIREAAAGIRGAVLETPCAHSRTLSEITGCEVILKFENLQFTASFKERGALWKLLSLDPEQRRRGVIAMSAGNHAQGVAYHARRLGIPVVIAMPSFTPSVKVERTRQLGAEVILHGDDLEEAGRFTEALARERGLALIHPYDDPWIISGQGTAALELVAARPDLEVLVVPVGGGGLIAGSALAAKGILPGIEVVGVESARFPSMRQALAGEPIRCGSFTLAEGIAVKAPGRLTREIVRESVDEILLVDEPDIERAVLLLLDVEKTVVEGAGAAGLAAVLAHGARFAGRRTGLILSGGNIDLLLLSHIIERGLVRDGRLLRLEVTLRDRPGALADVTRCLADAQANIVQVEHHRTFTRLPLESTVAEFVLHTRGVDHVREIFERLAAAGFTARPTEPDGPPL